MIIANTFFFFFSKNAKDSFMHGYHQVVHIEIRLIIFFVAKDGEAVQSAKTGPGANCGSDYQHLIAKFRLKLNK